MNGDKADGFYQLVYYPVVCASWMNKKFLYRDKAYIYAKQNRISAYDYARWSEAAQDSIAKETAFFNERLAGGKWKGIISMKPRDLPVFQSPQIPSFALQRKEGWDVAPEGYDTTSYQNKKEKKLPGFTIGMRQQYFIDVFLTDSITVFWKARSSSPWISLSQYAGTLIPMQSNNSVRLWVHVDWGKLATKGQTNGIIEFSGGGKKIQVLVPALHQAPESFSAFRGFVESNGYISMFAAHFSEQRNKQDHKWSLTPGTGHTHASMTAIPISGAPVPDTANLEHTAAYVAYTFYSFSQVPPKVAVYTLPTHPLNTRFSMRYGVRMDDGPIKIADAKTAGRSEEWKQNVLRNSAIRTLTFPALFSGKHMLKIYAIDPGVILDRITIDLGNGQQAYGVIAETRK